MHKKYFVLLLTVFITQETCTVRTKSPDQIKNADEDKTTRFYDQLGVDIPKKSAHVRRASAYSPIEDGLYIKKLLMEQELHERSRERLREMRKKEREKEKREEEKRSKIIALLEKIELADDSPKVREWVKQLAKVVDFDLDADDHERLLDQAQGKLEDDHQEQKKKEMVKPILYYGSPCNSSAMNGIYSDIVGNFLSGSSSSSSSNEREDFSGCP